MWEANPPFDRRAVERTCRQAASATAPGIAILPAVLDDGRRLDVAAYACKHGGTILARFPAGGMAFVPFGFWTGVEMRGVGTTRLTKEPVVWVAWHMPRATARARQELRELILAGAAPGQWPTTEHSEEWVGGPWSADDLLPRYSGRVPELELQEDGFVLAEEQPQRSDDWERSERPRMAAMMTGPWRALRWWRSEGLGASPESLDETETRTWHRMMRWGVVPEEVDEFLEFAGFSDVGRKAFKDAVAK